MSNNLELSTLQEFFPNFQKDFLVEVQKRGLGGYFDFDKLLTLYNNYQEDPIRKFKIYECPLPNCTLKTCPFYHSIQDQRRDPNVYTYSIKPCFAHFCANIWTYVKPCIKGLRCEFSHNRNEIMYHPDSDEIPSEAEKTVVRKGDKHAVTEKSDQISLLREQIREIEKEICRKSKELQGEQEEVETLRGISMCPICGIFVYKFVLPCGHFCCELCQDDTGNECLLCRARFDRSGIVRIANGT